MLPVIESSYFIIFHLFIQSTAKNVLIFNYNDDNKIKKKR
jgi:hypothetical protein